MDKKMILLLTIFMSLTFTISVYAEGMAVTRSDGKTDARFSYYYDDGSYIKNDWKKVNDKWFYFGDDGITIQNAWAEINGKWYYFDNWSVMLHDTTTPDGYTVGSDGAWITE